MSDTLTHLDAQGQARMVDVGDKPQSERRAHAQTFVSMAPETLQAVLSGQHKKGDVFAVARIAGIQAAKKCSDLIPLCHPLMLTHIDVQLQAEPEHSRIRLDATCALSGKTGVEMEALTAVSVAALTVYDMCKALDKAMVIGPTQLMRKSGGRSGEWIRDPQGETP